ncbi:unnamed protein product [Caenorhabditis auriculariae]|uniref:Uncharacterized protein n=1 Tax=Caenorhabditis auriculariae TaxID=2777116 RepID=A0A8S1HN00_9PELO|nr:unnamed protein product [Caenorhabditis auriculariae]
MSNRTAVGIDFGTCYSTVGVFRNGEVEIIPDADGNLRTPSFVAFSGQDVLVGQAAKNQVENNAENTVYNVLRLLGGRFEDPKFEDLAVRVPYEVIDEDGRPAVEVNFEGHRTTFLLEEIVALILRHLKKQAEDHLNRSVEEVVISMSGSWSTRQRQAMHDAAKIAGLKVLRLFRNPVSSMYGFHFASLEDDDEEDEPMKPCQVIDVGGGFCQTCVAVLDQGVCMVRAVADTKSLGSVDFDQILISELVKKLPGGETVHNVERLRKVWEEEERKSCRAKVVSLKIDDITLEVDRNKFEDDCWKLFDEFEDILAEALIKADLRPDDIADIVVVGGWNKVPGVGQTVANFFYSEDIITSQTSDVASTQGAAILAAQLSTPQIDERLQNVFLIDVCPRSLGIEIGGSKMALLLEKNSKIPSRTSRKFNRSEIGTTVRILEGEERDFAKNDLVATFDIPEDCWNGEEVEIDFEVGLDNDLTVFLPRPENRDFKVEIGSGGLSRSQLQACRERLCEGRPVNLSAPRPLPKPGPARP